MPYADPADKKKAMQRWRRNVISKGYGKWLYARRKLRFDDAERFRLVLEEIAADDPDRSTHYGQLAHRALAESRAAEEALGEWIADDART